MCLWGGDRVQESREQGTSVKSHRDGKSADRLELVLLPWHAKPPLRFEWTAIQRPEEEGFARRRAVEEGEGGHQRE